MATIITPPDRRSVLCRRRLSIPLHRAVATLGEYPAAVVGVAPSPGEAPDDIRMALSVPGPGGSQIGREVRVGFGPMLVDHDVHALPLWWEAAAHPAWFPTFDGGLELVATGDGTELRLAGSYLPPLGSLGAFADGVVGHRLVVASLDAFVEEVARRLTEAAG